ncbi:hypothetical protein ACQKKX_02745 [Neorhizobium sp. NPDC001467]|uniref:hypothetical protein n=1 Tax=Neorhizobium sp. NPDC001467 TaxID=3390595 RepID=UPI003CFF22C9
MKIWPLSRQSSAFKRGGSARSRGAIFLFSERTEIAFMRFPPRHRDGASLAQLLIWIKSFISVSELLNILSETGRVTWNIRVVGDLKLSDPRLSGASGAESREGGSFGFNADPELASRAGFGNRMEMSLSPVTRNGHAGEKGADVPGKGMRRPLKRAG